MAQCRTNLVFRMDESNMMLNRLDTRMKGTLSTESMNHWTAVARFFKALDYCRLVSVFGDVPYFGWIFNWRWKIFSLQDRTPRNIQMPWIKSTMISNIQFQNLRENDGNQCLNKNIAGFISGWMLFEGTWQKYQNNDNTRAKVPWFWLLLKLL